MSEKWNVIKQETDMTTMSKDMILSGLTLVFEIYSDLLNAMKTQKENI